MGGGADRAGAGGDMLKSWRAPWILKFLPVWWTDAYHYQRYFKACKRLQAEYPEMYYDYEPMCFDKWRKSYLNPRRPIPAPIFRGASRERTD